MRIRHAIGCLAGAGLICAVWFGWKSAVSVSAEKPVPFFKIDAAGQVTCETDPTADAYSEKISRPSGDWYLVQGSHTRKEYEAPNPQFHDEGLVAYPFAYLCERRDDRLKPFYDFLEDGEKWATLESADLDKDGVAEVILTASMGLARSYVRVFRVSGGNPKKIFEALSDNANAFFEKSGSAYRIRAEVAERPRPEGKKPPRFNQQVFEWDGRTFRLAA